MATVAALGLALSGCGSGGSGDSSATAASAQGSSQTQGSAPSQGSTTTASTSTPSTPSSPPAGSTGLTGGSGPPAASARTLTINWIPPTENTDGSALTNLAGYNIHYGTASHTYTQVISVSNAGLATYVVENLSPGTYYFAVGAVNANGTESPLSSEVTTTVD